MDDGMTFDFGDGVSALDRLMRSIVMMTDGAIGQLITLGYDRERDISVNVHEDGLPVWINLRRERVFLIETVVTEGSIKVHGKWTKEVKRHRRWFSWMFRS